MAGTNTWQRAWSAASCAFQRSMSWWLCQSFPAPDGDEPDVAWGAEPNARPRAQDRKAGGGCGEP